MLKITIPRNLIIKPLQSLLSIADKKHTLPVLSCILLTITENSLVFQVFDLEIEIILYIPISHDFQHGKIAIPVRKFNSIIRHLPENSEIHIAEELNNRIIISSNRSRFALSSFKPSLFPSLNKVSKKVSLVISLKHLMLAIKRVQFAMALNDVRYFLNGMLWEIRHNKFRTVATDGHRMARSEILLSTDFSEHVQIIVPRKAILELQKLSATAVDTEITVEISDNHFEIIFANFRFTSKLIEGRFPDYTRVIPPNNTKHLIANRLLLKQALTRTAILSNELYRSVRLTIEQNSLFLSANNPDHEEAQDQLDVNYSDTCLEIGFNVNYLLDIVNVLDSDLVNFYFDSPSMSLLVQDEPSHSLYVVSPIKL